MSRMRRNWTPEEKAAIVLELLREESTLAEIAKKYDVSQQLISRWKAEFLSNMSAVFDKKNENIEKIQREHEDEKEHLIKKIGELTLDVDWLKKKQVQISQMKKKGR
ncbi:transposase IS3/IS911 (plasmid) [Peptoclostridium acidaminophilum DSM 3953]|uniref:Transposase IS3/IS911 n=1 Tax=Peptoclostridium acidaminophilum DSM 3953 TaxID=1286171 RepID=W8T666_PEPAC|nr:transposase IS3/IS911 [Peptoclostridium acidaminophilum DSM 3953]AHM56375.1 transposase IS3/IS911 [Peptoclostridium acidaminophilum DSM 3953]AHM57631.1 transposase IS3/IS911 [Peptoclostridium acidaminophilum DSM 3953]AHM57701.1 transposase IS3/IS911 [Peptoclostridium acidaminophilum DSM 3953]AHM57712.1 transposase IS3/IS911 [Peptoclostridium acidaminophilum DSM 3953]